MRCSPDAARSTRPTFRELSRRRSARTRSLRLFASLRPDVPGAPRARRACKGLAKEQRGALAAMSRTFAKALVPFGGKQVLRNRTSHPTASRWISCASAQARDRAQRSPGTAHAAAPPSRPATTACRAAAAHEPITPGRTDLSETGRYAIRPAASTSRSRSTPRPGLGEDVGPRTPDRPGAPPATCTGARVDQEGQGPPGCARQRRPLHARDTNVDLQVLPERAWFRRRGGPRRAPLRRRALRSARACATSSTYLPRTPRHATDLRGQGVSGDDCGALWDAVCRPPRTHRQRSWAVMICTWSSSAAASHGRAPHARARTRAVTPVAPAGAPHPRVARRSPSACSPGVSFKVDTGGSWLCAPLPQRARRIELSSVACAPSASSSARYRTPARKRSRSR